MSNKARSNSVNGSSVNAVKLTYPNAVFCAISLKGAPVKSEGGRSKYEISRACTEAATMHIPSMHDFSLEKSILQKSEEHKQKGHEKMSMRRFQSVSSISSGRLSPPTTGGIETSFSNKKTTSSLTSDQRKKLNQLKNIISTDESVCLALLEEHQFQVDRAADAFFAS